jgi:hypothetical protein
MRLQTPRRRVCTLGYLVAIIECGIATIADAGAIADPDDSNFDAISAGGRDPFHQSAHPREGNRRRPPIVPVLPPWAELEIIYQLGFLTSASEIAGYAPLAGRFAADLKKAPLSNSHYIGGRSLYADSNRTQPHIRRTRAVDRRVDQTRGRRVVLQLNMRLEDGRAPQSMKPRRGDLADEGSGASSGRLTKRRDL